MYICTQQYAFEAVEKKGGRGSRKSLQWGVRVIGFFFSLFFNNRLSTQKCMILMKERDMIQGRGGAKFSIRVGSVMDRSGWCVYVSRPRRRGPTERWWTPGPRPPPAGGWCRLSHCWWWSGRSSERRSAAASQIPSGAAEESHPEVKEEGGGCMFSYFDSHILSAFILSQDWKKGWVKVIDLRNILVLISCYPESIHKRHVWTERFCGVLTVFPTD